MPPSPYARRHPLRAEEGSVGLSTPGFVGRERELAALAAALARPPAVVLVEGEAGIGKTRLLGEWLASPAAERHRSLVTACAPLPEPLTLSPIVDAVRQARESVAGLRLSALAGALRPLFPEWAELLPPPPEPLDDARAARHRLFRALHEAIDGLGVSLLVVEDLHWADRATLEFLLFVLSRRHAGLSLVVTYRREDLPAGSLVLRLSARPPADATPARIALSPLNLGDATRLVSSMLDDEPLSEEFATFLYERTDGVPLAVEESVRLLHERDHVARRDGQWVRRSLDELQVPPTVRDSVLERVRRLGRQTQLLVQVAAVVGEPVDEALVSRVAGLPPSRVRAGLHEALAAGLLQEDRQGRAAFRHALMGQAVYEAIPGPERRRLHLATGQALKDAHPPPVVQLARHFREAGDPAKWAGYAEQAAAMAVDSNDHTTAVRLLTDVLTAAALPAHASARLALKLGRATLFRSEAVDDLNRDAALALRAVLDHPGVSSAENADIRSHLGRVLMQLGDWETGYRELELAAASLGHDPVGAARVMTYLGWPVIGWRSASVHRHWLGRVAELDPCISSPVDRITLTANHATALVLLGDRAGWELAAGLPTTAASREERWELARAYSNLAWASIVWGRYADANTRLQVARRLTDSDGFAAIRDRLQSSQLELDWLTGAWEGRADRLAPLLDTTADEVEPSIQSSVLLTVGRLHSARGSRDQADKHFRVILARARRQGLVDDVLEAAVGLARLRLADGRTDDALQLTDEPMQTLVRKGVWMWATGIAPVRVEALVAAGKIEDASRLATRFAHGLRGRDAPGPRAALATCRALLIEGTGQADRAAAAFARAARAWQRLPRPYDALLARERQARCLLAGGRPEAGLNLLSEVFHGLTDLGAHGDADRVAHQLRRHGVPVARPWRGGRRGYGAQLSPRELDVVRFVVTGCTNREIARVLSRSPRTVSTQVNSAMRKLGVSSRTALAVKAVETGIGPDDGRPAGATNPAPRGRQDLSVT